MVLDFLRLLVGVVPDELKRSGVPKGEIIVHGGFSFFLTGGWQENISKSSYITDVIDTHV
jgi:hypothetical protein